MNADLIDGLARVADSSENVPQLRRLVVALAITGKLDTSGDEDSFILMRERLKEERERLVKMGKLKRQGELPPVSSDELPFEISSPCHFERLGNLAMLAKGLTGIQSAAPGPFPLVVTAEDRASCDHFDFDGAAAIVPMVSSAGHGKASIKRLHYQEGKFALGNILCAAFPLSDDLISARFLYEYLTTFKEDLLVTRMIGTANVSLTIGKIAEVPVPLVSRRIQQRVDELMVLCDRLEAAQVERESRRDRLAAASLHRLNNGGDADAFRKHARFYFNHLPRLTTRSEHIQQLRQAILNLAIRGKLVHQDPNDEPASELLKKIQAEKAQLVKEGKIKKFDPVEPPCNSDFPLQLPSGWTAANLQSVCISVADGDHLPPPQVDHGIPFLVIGNVRGKTMNFVGCRYVSEQYYNALDSIRRPKKGDVLYTLVGSYGIPIMVTDDRMFCVQRHIGVLRPSTAIKTGFINHVLESRWVFDQATACATGIAQKTVPLSGLRRILIPLPPFAEQDRIVAKIEELMALCDRLEAQLTNTQTESRRLLEAVLHEALAV